MGKIFCIMGKSSSGKDTLYKMLLEKKDLGLEKIVLYTTRPIRSGEQEGREYFFVSENELAVLQAEGKVIEVRTYATIHGPWSYFTADDGQICLQDNNYLMITTLEAYAKLSEYFGSSVVIPVYVEVEDGMRLQRALDRERMEAEPKYAELCRRFLADAEDFSDEKLSSIGIERHFLNENSEKTCAEIADYIRLKMQE